MFWFYKNQALVFPSLLVLPLHLPLLLLLLLPLLLCLPAKPCVPNEPNAVAEEHLVLGGREGEVERHRRNPKEKVGGVHVDEG